MTTRPNSTQKRALRRIIYKRDNGRCRLCFQPVGFEESTLDHITPKSEGGGFEPGNIRLAHKRCNEGRGVLPTKQAPARLSLGTLGHPSQH